MYRQHLDSWAEKAQEVSTCTRGCNHCCRMLVRSSLAEGALLAAHLLQSTAWLSEIRELRLKLAEESDFIRSLPSGQKSVKYFEARKPCLFLDLQTGDCRIYSIRPAACRTYFVVSDPSLCSPDRSGGPVSVVDMSKAEFSFIQALINQTADIIPPLTGSLQSMVLSGMELILHSSGHFKRWIQGRQINDMDMAPDALTPQNP